MPSGAAHDLAREGIDLGGVVVDHVLAHGGGAARIERPLQRDHARKLAFGDRDALGRGHSDHLAHGRHIGAEILAQLVGHNLAIGNLIGGAGLVDAHVQHEFGPKAIGDVLLNQVGEVGRFEDGAYGVEGRLRRLGEHADVELAIFAIGEGGPEPHGVHALRYAHHDAVPAVARGDGLLARDAVEHGDDAGVRADQGGHQVEGGRQGEVLDGDHHEVDGTDFLGRPVGQVDHIAVDGVGIRCMAPDAVGVHGVCHMARPERLGRARAVEQAECALADDGYGGAGGQHLTPRGR